jgi:glycosyltransferase involved in cell wall biosynthesis
MLGGMARIGFDGLMISPAGKGLARVERHAVEALAARGDHEFVAFVRQPVDLAGVEVVCIRERLTIDWELHGLGSAADRHRLDAFLSLSERLPFAPKLPIVVWLFESPVHRIRQNRASGAPLWHRASDLLTAGLWRGSLRRAARIAFGSEATRAEVLAELPELAERSSVVYPGLPPGFGPGPARDRGEYVLHLGSGDPRENTAAAVGAARRAGIRLLVVGGWQGDGAESLGRITDDELIELYRGATAFLDPTLYEGFGYGVLEAMACGAPVVASNRTSVPEVVGDAGLLCDPRSEDELAAALRRILHEPGLARSLRERGVARAARFTWEETSANLSRELALALGLA